MKMSLYVKILLLLLFSWLFVSIGLGVTAALSGRGPEREQWKQRKEAFARILADYLGDPPDFEKAEDLADSFGLDVQINGPGYTWSTNAARFRSPVRRKTRNTLEMGEFTLTFLDREQQNRLGFLLTFIFILGGLFAILYGIIRRLLRPVKELQAAAGRIARGELDQRVPRTSQDELGQLVDRFNTMAAELERMLKNRDQMVLDVSHELRSPLARARVALAMTEESPQKGMILADLEEMETLTGQLLDLYRLKESVFSLEMVPMNLQTLLLQVIGSFDREELIHYDSRAPEMRLPCDPLQLSRVLRNLIENALIHSSTRGLDIGVSVSGEKAVLTFRDFGPGVPEEHQEDIFEPFFRVDNSRRRKTGGYGIGLALSKRIAEAHHGSLRVENHPDGGAVFTLELPLSPQITPE